MENIERENIREIKNKNLFVSADWACRVVEFNVWCKFRLNFSLTTGWCVEVARGRPEHMCGCCCCRHTIAILYFGSKSVRRTTPHIYWIADLSKQGDYSGQATDYAHDLVQSAKNCLVRTKFRKVNLRKLPKLRNVNFAANKMKLAAFRETCFVYESR